MSKDSKKGFGALADMKKQLAAEEEAKRAPPPPPPMLTPTKGATRPAEDDASAFARAMFGVKKLGDDGRGERIAKPKEAAPVAPKEDEVDALVDLASSIDIDPTRGIDPRITKKLQRGEFPISAQLDLHGKRKVEAEQALERFIKQARAEKSRAVLVITGKGTHSEAGPVLRDAVEHALSKTLLKHVLAFCPARPEDGGDGAFYVLVRRR